MDEELEALLRMLIAECDKQVDWLRDLFYTVDGERLPDPDTAKLVKDMTSMCTRKLEKYPSIWNDITWVAALHQKFLALAQNAEKKGEGGDETAMLAMMAFIGWMEALRIRFEELGGIERLKGEET